MHTHTHIQHPYFTSQIRIKNVSLPLRLKEKKSNIFLTAMTENPSLFSSTTVTDKPKEFYSEQVFSRPLWWLGSTEKAEASAETSAKGRRPWPWIAALYWVPVCLSGKDAAIAPEKWLYLSPSFTQCTCWVRRVPVSGRPPICFPGQSKLSKVRLLQSHRGFISP